MAKMNSYSYELLWPGTDFAAAARLLYIAYIYFFIFSKKEIEITSIGLHHQNRLMWIFTELYSPVRNLTCRSSRSELYVSWFLRKQKVASRHEKDAID